MLKRGRKNERKRKKERIVRESGCCVPAGSGVLIRWKEVLCVGGCTKRRPKGGRVYTSPWKGVFVPYPAPLPFSYLSAFSPSPLPFRFVRHLFHLLLLVFFFVFARLVNASRRPGRTLHTQLFTSRLSGPSLPPWKRRPLFSPRHEIPIFLTLLELALSKYYVLSFSLSFNIDNRHDIFRDLSKIFIRNIMLSRK